MAPCQRVKNDVLYHYIIFNVYSFYLHVIVIEIGNAKYQMDEMSFTLIGFTESEQALPIIEDCNHNVRRFTSRLLWYFPKPIFCRLEDTLLTLDESVKVSQFQSQLGKCISFAKLLYFLKRGKLGGSEHRNTTEKFAKYRNIAKKLPNTAILQYCVETQCHTETATLYNKFRANNTETEIKIWKCSI